MATTNAQLEVLVRELTRIKHYVAAADYDNINGESLEEIEIIGQIFHDIEQAADKALQQVTA